MAINLFHISHELKHSKGNTQRSLCVTGESRKAWLHMWLYAAFLVNLTCCSASRLTLNGCALPSSMTCGDQSLVSGLQDIQYSELIITHQACSSFLTFGTI